MRERIIRRYMQIREGGHNRDDSDDSSNDDSDIDLLEALPYFRNPIAIV